MAAETALVRPSQLEEIRLGLATLTGWPLRRWLVALLAGVTFAVVSGVPTGILSTSLYTRMTPVTWWDYPVWAFSAVFVGLTAATYVRMGVMQQAPTRTRRTMGAAVVSTLAVGCPVCNKLVVGLIGVSGALSVWAPLQPVLGVMSVSLLLLGLLVRLRGAIACSVTVPA